MVDKICLVTGASRGIGFHTALGLARKGAFVVLVGHNQQRAERASRRINAYAMKKTTDFLVADLSSQEEIYKLAEMYKEKYNQLDVLVNNVGGFFLKHRESVDGIELTFALNHLSYFMTTLLLLDAILSSGSARIINVSSESHRGHEMNFDDLQLKNGYNGMRAYGQSKLANLLFTYELSRRLTGTGVTVNALHPGFVRTYLGKQNELVRGVMEIVDLFAKGPEEGAKTPVYLANSPDVAKITGQYFIAQKQVPSSSESYDTVSMEGLWQVSEQLCGLDTSRVQTNVTDSAFHMSEDDFIRS